MSKKVEIPKVPQPGDDGSRVAFDRAVKEDLEIIMGRRGAVIKPLQSTATLADCIAKINAIVDRLQ